MSELSPNQIPRLAPGCRLNAPGGAEDLLLIPEGALRLKGPGRSIVELCDGERSIREVVETLHQRFPSEDAARIQTEVFSFLTRLRDRGVLEAA